MDKMLISALNDIPEISLTNPGAKRLPGIVSIIVDKTDFNNERFIKKISDSLALSTGSACSAGDPSYVISSMGLVEKISKVLRVSINKYTTKQDIIQLIEILKNEI